MRPIKFRCWNKERNEMVYGVDLYDGNMAFEGINDNAYEFDNKTLGQFTGLLDKNGKEIYEWDIIEVYDFFGKPTGRYTVEYKLNAFNYYEEGKPETALYFAKDLVAVVGNIYETL